MLFLVENLSVPSDDRVWREACAVRDLGCDVVVCCPTGRGAEAARRERVDGIDIRRFPGLAEGPGVVALGAEYVNAVLRMLHTVVRLDLERRVDVVHVANPPDLLALVAATLRLRHPLRVVYDQHDLVPELVETRFPGRRGLRRLAGLLERCSVALADEVVVANEAFAARLAARSRPAGRPVTVVRNAPDPRRFVRVPPDPGLKAGKEHLLAYVGVMGPQDGAELAVEAIAHLVQRRGRSDLHAVFVGDGSALADCRSLAAALGVADVVDFVGWQGRAAVARYLSTADLALVPDPRSPLNDRSSMVKVIEYLTLGVPFVAFDLPETVRTAGGAARIVPGNDVAAFARALHDLLDDPVERERMGREGVERARGPFGWDAARAALEGVYTRLGAAAVAPLAGAAPPPRSPRVA